MAPVVFRKGVGSNLPKCAELFASIYRSDNAANYENYITSSASTPGSGCITPSTSHSSLEEVEPAGGVSYDAPGGSQSFSDPQGC